jgi:hypothetical protein
MELLSSLCFQVLPLNATITLSAHGIIQFVVMTVTVWMVINDIERCSRERLSTSFANKALAKKKKKSASNPEQKPSSIELKKLTLLMVSSRQSTIRRTNRLPFDDLTTAFAVALMSRSCSSPWLW